jgi:hypothetical protein
VKIYLDVCSIQRPLDTPSQVRIILEADAVLGILAFCDSGQAELVSSEALVYEIGNNPLPVRREHGVAVLAKAKHFVTMTEDVKKRAGFFMEHGIKNLDSLHLALAEKENVEYFCTCDDRFLRNAKRIPNQHVKVLSPVDLIQEIEK